MGESLPQKDEENEEHQSQYQRTSESVSGIQKAGQDGRKADWDYIHWVKKRKFDMPDSNVVTGEYTAEEEEVIRNMLDSGHTNTEVAKKLNRNISSVSHKARKLGYV